MRADMIAPLVTLLLLAGCSRTSVEQKPNVEVKAESAQQTTPTPAIDLTKDPDNWINRANVERGRLIREMDAEMVKSPDATHHRRRMASVKLWDEYEERAKTAPVAAAEWFVKQVEGKSFQEVFPGTRPGEKSPTEGNK